MNIFVQGRTAYTTHFSPVAFCAMCVVCGGLFFASSYNNRSG